jgi:outer membrane lipoprotein-sorting protein
MRWSLAVLGCLVVVPVGRAQDRAQKLYEAMEQKIAKCKAFRFDFEIDTDQGGPMKAKGILILASDNRLKVTFEVESKIKDGTRKSKGIMISDGKTFAETMETDSKPTTDSKAVSGKLFGVFVEQFCRTGAFTSVEGIHRLHRANPKEDPLPKPGGFKLLTKEKIAGRDTNVIEFQLMDADPDTKMTCKLWLDPESNLPLKRIFEVDRKGLFRRQVIETYSHWELDPKLPDGTFALPK